MGRAGLFVFLGPSGAARTTCSGGEHDQRADERGERGTTDTAIAAPTSRARVVETSHRRSKARPVRRGVRPRSKPGRRASSDQLRRGQERSQVRNHHVSAENSDKGRTTMIAATLQDERHRVKTSGVGDTETSYEQQSNWFKKPKQREPRCGQSVGGFRTARA